MSLCWTLLLLAACGPKPSSLPQLCDDPQRGCILKSDAGDVTVRFTQPASAMKPFEVLVFPAGKADKVSAEFRMADMEMAEIDYRLTPIRGGWGGKVILPVCVSGSRHWFAVVRVDGKPVTMRFTVEN